MPTERSSLKRPEGCTKYRGAAQSARPGVPGYTSLRATRGAQCLSFGHLYMRLNQTEDTYSESHCGGHVLQTDAYVRSTLLRGRGRFKIASFKRLWAIRSPGKGANTGNVR